MEQWVQDNKTLILVVAAFVVAVLGFGMIWAGLKDWRSIRTADADVARIRGGYTIEQPALTEAMLDELDKTTNLSLWARIKKSTEPRYADVPTAAMVSVPGARHGDPSEDWAATDEQVAVVDEGVESYVGKHRLPEAVTAEYLARIFTQTSEFPVVRTLNPSWRGAVA